MEEKVEMKETFGQDKGGGRLVTIRMPARRRLLARGSPRRATLCTRWYLHMCNVQNSKKGHTVHQVVPAHV